MNGFKVLFLLSDTNHGLFETTLGYREISVQLLFESHISLATANPAKQFTDLLLLITQFSL